MKKRFRELLVPAVRAVVTLTFMAGASGCFLFGGSNNDDAPAPAGNPYHCAPSQLASNPSAPSTGSALVFSPDPIIASGQVGLSPRSPSLDNFVSSVQLQHLGNRGVLEGSFVDVRNGIGCGGSFGAYALGNQFSYSHGDSRFQEAMAYHWGDQYRSGLSSYGYLQPAQPVQIWAHCMNDDNAYFSRGHDSTGHLIERVCLGDSVATQGASYADDATVTVHELQHATTTDTYSTTQPLNELWYDEAGAMNEAISDFMALVFTQPFLTPAFDPKLFSRWALGTFIPGRQGTRGAHKCPTYDPTYPNCASFPAFSATNNTISYVYPDGLGWPYANNFTAPGYANSSFSTYSSQEEIHNAGILLVGALWDVYDAIKTNHGGDEAQARMLSSKLVLESLKHLPKPSNTAVSPVTFRGLASQMVLYAAGAGLTNADQVSMSAALTARGLLGGTQVSSSWGAVGPGNSSITPGIRVQDNPSLLAGWLMRMLEISSGAGLVPQGEATGLNSKLDPGELAAIWFDIQDIEAQTAGGVQLTVTSLDPDVTFDTDFNIAPISSAVAQIRYGKVNGTSIVTSLTSNNATYNVSTGNSYFRTNPFFDRSWTTALWVRVKSTATHGKTIHFQVDAVPSNGASTRIDFPATIQ